MLINSLSTLHLTQDLRYLVNFPLLIVGMGFFVLSFAWFVPLMLTVLVTTTITAIPLRNSSSDLDAYILPFLISVMIGVLVNRTRASNILHLEGLRLLSRRRGFQLKEALDQVQSEVTRRREKEAQVKTLEGLLPICAGCKNVRDDEGYWKQIESFVEEHSSARFSHGLCPNCLEELYPDFLGGLKDSGR